MSSRATNRHPREELTVSIGMLKTAAAGLAVAAIALAGSVLSVATIRKYRHEPEPVFEGA